MSERRLKKDSETNRQWMNKMKRTKKLYHFVAVIIATAFISSAITLTISADPPDSAPNTVIDWEGLEAYKINGIRFALDGTTDAIQDAIDDLPAAGGLVVVPNGTYDWDATYSPTADNFALVGSGATVIRQTADGIGLRLNGLENVTIASITFDGDSGSKTGKTQTIRVIASENIIIRDVQVRNWYGAAFDVLCPSSNIRIESCTAISPDWSLGTNVLAAYVGPNSGLSHDVQVLNSYLEGAVYLASSNVTNCLISGNTIIGDPSAHGGIYVFQGASHSTISDNRITGWVHSGIECRGNNISFQGNVITECGGGIEIFNHYLLVDDANDISVMGNTITDNDGIGIYVYKLAPATVSPNRVTISGNTICNNTDSGIQVEDEVTGVVIDGNIISFNGYMGVESSSTTSHSVAVTNNIFESNSNIPIYSVAPNSIIADNLIYHVASATAISVGGHNVSVIGNVLVNWTVTAGHGISLSYVEDFVVSGNVISDLWGVSRAIYMDTCTRGTVSGNEITDITGASAWGIVVRASTSITVSGNALSNTGNSAVFVYLASSCISVSDNAISYAGGTGIYLTACIRSTIVGNVIRNCAGDGVGLTDCYNVTIMGNVAVDSRTPCIQEYGVTSYTSDYLTLIGNILTPNLEGNYTLSGTNNIIYGNR